MNLHVGPDKWKSEGSGKQIFAWLIYANLKTRPWAFEQLHLVALITLIKVPL